MKDAYEQINKLDLNPRGQGGILHTNIQAAEKSEKLKEGEQNMQCIRTISISVTKENKPITDASGQQLSRESSEQR